MKILSPLIGIIIAIVIYLFIGHVACGILPDQRWNPCLLPREHGVLTAGPPGKSHYCL